MKQRLTIPGRLPGWNELTSGWHYASRNRMKKEAMDIVGWEIKRQRIKPVVGKVTVTISCYEPNARRDDDNATSGAAKIVLDSLKNCGIIKGDGRKYVRCIKCPAEIDRARPRVEIEIREDKGNEV